MSVRKPLNCSAQQVNLSQSCQLAVAARGQLWPPLLPSAHSGTRSSHELTEAADIPPPAVSHPAVSHFAPSSSVSAVPLGLPTLKQPQAALPLGLPTSTNTGQHQGKGYMNERTSLHLGCLRQRCRSAHNRVQAIRIMRHNSHSPRCQGSILCSTSTKLNRRNLPGQANT
jgi:hypothetical protein